MKKNVRKALAISGLAIAIGASGLTLTASADTNSKNQRFERHQNPYKISRATKKVDSSEKTKWHRRAIPGFVSSISNDSITIKKGNKEFIVKISNETRILDRTWKTINLSEIKTGHKIRVFGTLSGTTVTAQTIRDISIK